MSNKNLIHNTARKIFIIDKQDPEDVAMLQALYSRSPASVKTHQDKLEASGSGKFMSQYYVGYGHASIGDCGTTTIFIEQVSMLVAKAIQDTPLYNGQEVSTRYLDFAMQNSFDSYDGLSDNGQNETLTKRIQWDWFGLYHKILPEIKHSLESKYAFNEIEYKSKKIWDNALTARAFDITRALLPVGTLTSLSWTTTLRAARDHLRRLKYHPLPEVVEAALNIFSELRTKYPNSFHANDMEGGETPRDKYYRKFAKRTHFIQAHDLINQFDLSVEDMQLIKEGNIVTCKSALDLIGLNTKERETLAERPSGAVLPWRLESYGRYNFQFLLDFGSFRDLQRHRNGVCQIPFIDSQFGMHPWYMTEMEEHLSRVSFGTVKDTIQLQCAAIDALAAQGIQTSPLLNQYLYPMGMQALVHASYSVPQTVYVGELRSGKTVHPSLRPIAQKMLGILEQDLPGMALYGDRDEESWTAKRGEQTIASKVA